MKTRPMCPPKLFPVYRRQAKSASANFHKGGKCNIDVKCPLL
jgi:hypothetical protein